MKLTDSSSTSNSNSTGNTIHNSINVSSGSKLGTIISIVIPLVAAVLGAYAKYQFDLSSAPQKTLAQTQTLLGLMAVWRIKTTISRAWLAAQPTGSKQPPIVPRGVTRRMDCTCLPSHALRQSKYPCIHMRLSYIIRPNA